MKPGDMVFVKGSALFARTTPLILLEVYRHADTNNSYYVVLDTETGIKHEYQEHDLTEFPT